MNPIVELYNLVFYQPIFNILMAIYAPLQHVSMGFGLAIILMTLLVRALLVPIFMRQLRSSKAMQEIGPQVQELQRKYRQEPMVLQQELNALYKANGVNPLMGCLPLLVQLPFLWSVYGSLNAILAYINNQGSVKATNEIMSHLYPFTQTFLGPNGLRSFLVSSQVSFLGINLAKTDPHFILPVLAALLTFAQMRMSMTKKPAPKPGQAPDPNAATMQMMQYIFPVMTLFFGLRFPAGLALYWVITTAFTIGQQYFVNGRTWGGLLRGIPGLDPELKMAAAGVGAVSVTETPRRGGRVVEALPASSKTSSPARSLTAPKTSGDPPARANGSAKTPKTVESKKAVNSAIEEDDQQDDQKYMTASDMPVKSATPSRPLATKTPTKPAAPKSGAVKLVSTANGHANGSATVVAPRTTTRTSATVSRPISTAAKPRTVSTGNPKASTNKSTPSRSRKGAR